MTNRKEDELDNHNHEHENGVNQVGGFFAGLLIGGLAGAVAMLLLAPQSGKKTRAKIEQKSIELRDQAVKNVEDAMAQTRTKAHQITADVREKADELEQRGQDVIDEQRDQWGTTLKGLGKAVHT
jgi:gas vesicle protein